MWMRRGSSKEMRLLLVCLKAQELLNLHSPLTCQGQFQGALSICKNLHLGPYLQRPT